MRVADLIAVVGGLKPNASPDRAYLQRVNADGTQGPLLVLDLTKVMTGDPIQNVELLPKDKLSVFTQEETAYRVDETVRVIGAVQRPGTFRRASNMTLKDAISFAGGAFPNAAETLELTRAWSEIGAPTVRIKLADVLAGLPSANVSLQPGDTITLPTRTDLIEKPRIVQILGAVKYPGPYMLTGRNDRLSNLVQRSGGLTDRAFTPGAEFVRDPKFLTTARQLVLQPRLAAAFRLVSEDEFKRAQALVDLDRLRIVFAQGSSFSGSTQLLPTQTPDGKGGLAIQPGKSLDQALAESLRSEAATAARVLGERELIPSGNLNVNVEAAIRQPGGRTDVILQDGDTLIIPERPTTIAISGAVALPSAVAYARGESLAYYLDRAGGTSADAAIDLIIVVRASGTIVKYRRGVKIELGDHILVPTKVMAVRLREKVSDLQNAASGLASAGLTLALIRALSK
jgi:protein involved in polysaccharide export with SLBB domain